MHRIELADFLRGSREADRIPTELGHIKLGRWKTPVVMMVLICFGYEFVILFAPPELRPAQYYLVGSFGVGLVVSIGQLILEPGALRIVSKPANSASIK
jgi:hypothetical protein